MPDRNRTSRSRSPLRVDRPSSHHHRTRSPHSSRQHEQSRGSKSSVPAKQLPLHAQPLSKHDLRKYRPMFALYLDIQKQKYIEDMDEDEIKGRWKSFMGKWNRGELAEGWYDPKTLEKAIAADAAQSSEDIGVNEQEENQNSRSRADRHRTGSGDENEKEDDEYGPSLPTNHTTVLERQQTDHQQYGPSIPSLADLRARNEQLREESDAQYEERLRSLRNARKEDRRMQTDRLNDLVPRAEAGTRDRQLERKREVADSNRAFAAAKDATGDAELPETEILGEEDSLSSFKRMQKEAERKKSEREIRREETLRVRVAEREERMRGMKEKEDKTMESLKEIARRRFGAQI